MLTKRTESNTVYLQVKHFCLWREIKSPADGCETIKVTNPKTGDVIVKHGYRFDTVSGRAVSLVKYDTENKYPTRYFGFKLHLLDGAERYVVDMPYQSQVLRRFLRCARNIDWAKTFSLTVFKGRKRDGANTEETGIWFQQAGDTVKPYYTREQPHGMPEAFQDADTHEWDFRTQHRWLVDRLKSETIPDIELSAAKLAAPAELAAEAEPAAPTPHDEDPYSQGITDDDVPF